MLPPDEAFIEMVGFIKIVKVSIYPFKSGILAWITMLFSSLKWAFALISIGCGQGWSEPRSTGLENRPSSVFYRIPSLRGMQAGLHFLTIQY